MLKVNYFDKLLSFAKYKDNTTLLNGSRKSRFIENEEQLDLAMNYLFHSSIASPLTIYSQDLQGLWKKFQEQFTIVLAAGGVIKNDSGELLMILRLGKWDLPKGKLDANESEREAAVREVCEECGLTNVIVEDFNRYTYHLFENKKGKRILKRTAWYNMKSNDQSLTAQTEEDILDVRWMKKELVRNAMTNTYPLIKEIVQESHLTD